MSDEVKHIEMEDLFASDIASKGVRLELTTLQGEKTDAWIDVRGIDSPEYRAVRAAEDRRVVEISKEKDEKKREHLFEEARKAYYTKLRVAFVIGWSFKAPCTPENVAKLYEKNPAIMEKIEEVATTRDLFFTLASAASTTSPVVSSSSTSESKDPKPPSEST